MLQFNITRTTVRALAGIAIFSSPVALGAQVSEITDDASEQQPLTRAQTAAQLDASFKAADSNGDKMLSLAEIEAVQKIRMARISANFDKRLDAEFGRLDTNKDGQLSLAEFKAGAPGPRMTPASQLLAQVDRDKDGKISPEEHRAGPLANFDRVDKNKDGTLSAEEQAAIRRRR